MLWPLAMARIASVLLPLPLPEAFDYAEPEGMNLQVGDQVVAPLGPRRWIGVVSALRDGAAPVAAISRSGLGLGARAPRRAITRGRPGASTA